MSIQPQISIDSHMIYFLEVKIMDQINILSETELGNITILLKINESCDCNNLSIATFIQSSN